jgi:hypothetical protein
MERRCSALLIEEGSLPPTDVSRGGVSNDDGCGLSCHGLGLCRLAHDQRDDEGDQRRDAPLQGARDGKATDQGRVGW